MRCQGCDGRGYYQMYADRFTCNWCGGTGSLAEPATEEGIRERWPTRTLCEWVCLRGLRSMGIVPKEDRNGCE